MLRIDNQRARSRETELGADRGSSKRQPRNPVRRRNPRADLSLDRAGPVPAAVLQAEPCSTRIAAALPGEDDGREPGAGDAADRSLSGKRRASARCLPAPSLSASVRASRDRSRQERPPTMLLPPLSDTAGNAARPAPTRK